jgi:hypothetical protein
MTIDQATWNKYKAEIYELYYTRDYAIKDVVHVMERRRGFKASRESYKRQFKRWDNALTKRSSSILIDPALRALVTDLYHKNASHKEILRILRDFKGYPELKDRQLSLIRSKARLIYRRQATPAGVSPVYKQATTLVRQDLESSLITQWGWRSVKDRLLTAHKLFVDQATILRIMRELDPVATAHRSLAHPRRRQRYIVKGPNRIWSIDRHNKLLAYGF